MSGKGSADSRTPNFRAREEAWERIWGKKDPKEQGLDTISAIPAVGDPTIQRCQNLGKCDDGAGWREAVSELVHDLYELVLELGSGDCMFADPVARRWFLREKAKALGFLQNMPDPFPAWNDNFTRDCAAAGVDPYAACNAEAVGGSPDKRIVETKEKSE